MATLLYIESSPRKERSASIEVARTFIGNYKQTHPNDKILDLDLWQLEMPEFSDEVIEAKYAIMQDQSPTAAEIQSWHRVEELIAQFKQADKYLFSVPMWNFGIPYKLKHYLDLIIQPSYTFSFTPEQGFKGLVTSKPVALIYARGGEHCKNAEGQPSDLQVKYMQTVLEFIGFTKIEQVVVEPTAGSKKAEVVKNAQAKAAKLAAHF